MIKEGTCKFCGWEEEELFNGMCFSCLVEKTSLKKLNAYKKNKNSQTEILDFYLSIMGSNVFKILEKELFKNADVYKMVADEYITNVFSDWELEELAETIEG